MDQTMQEQAFDLFILDRLLPGEDGIQIMKRLKLAKDVPIIILSALSNPQDRVEGLESGADDYIAKPFDSAELVARVRAVLRRTYPDKDNAPQEQVTFGEFTFDRSREELTKAGVQVKLTSAELSLLKLLADSPFQILDRKLIREKLDGQSSEKIFRAVDIRVLRLRNKVETNPRTPRFIKTVWGRGYMFCPNDW